MKQYRISWMARERGDTSPARLAEVLGLKTTVLKRIEGFDISHLGGNETVGSMVVFENGLPKSSDYRHFKMRTVMGKPDDYRSMEEVLTRRLKYLQKGSNLRIAKSRKKQSELIQKWGTELGWKELEKPDWNNFYLLYKEKKPVGMARLIEIKKDIFMIEAIFILPEHRGELLSYAFMEKISGKVKNKKARIYIRGENHLLNHWMNFGFIEVKDAPEEVKQRKAGFEKLDNTKYTILAYYSAQKKKKDSSFASRPDLILVDGGKGQLGVAVSVLSQLKLDIPVISLAKRLEEIYMPEVQAPLLLEEGDEALKLLQRIRDESHRFAITFQRELHRKGLVNS
jgi:excinuclease ABC subunit C